MKKFQVNQVYADVGSLMHMTRRNIDSLTSKQYQILSVHGLSYDEQDYKVNKNTCVVSFLAI